MLQNGLISDKIVFNAKVKIFLECEEYLIMKKYIKHLF